MNNKEQIINGIMQNCKEVHFGKLKVPSRTRAIWCDGKGGGRGNQFINTDASAVTQWSLVSITSWTKRFRNTGNRLIFHSISWIRIAIWNISLSLLKLIRIKWTHGGHTLIPLTRELYRINCEGHLHWHTLYRTSIYGMQWQTTGGTESSPREMGTHIRSCSNKQ